MVVRFVHASTQESVAFEFDFDYGEPVVHLSDEEWRRLDGLLTNLNPAKAPYPAITRERSPAAPHTTVRAPTFMSSSAQPAA